MVGILTREAALSVGLASGVLDKQLLGAQNVSPIVVMPLFSLTPCAPFFSDETVAAGLDAVRNDDADARCAGRRTHRRDAQRRKPERQQARGWVADFLFRAVAHVSGSAGRQVDRCPR